MVGNVTMVTEEKMLRFKNVSFRNIVKVVEHRKKIMSKEYSRTSLSGHLNALDTP